MIKIEVNERLKYLREEILDIKQNAFAQKIEVARSTLSLIEKGDRTLNSRMIKLICQTFNVNEEWLRNGIEPIFKEDINKDNDVHINSLIKRYDINQDEIDIIKRLANLDESTRSKIVNFVFAMAKENIDKIDDNKILKFAKEPPVPPDKEKIVARGKGVTYEDANRINEIIENAEEVNLDDIDFL